MKYATFGAFILGLIISEMASSAALEEVIVTAQKRDQNIQDVSIAVSAFDGESLSRMGITNTTEVFAVVPNATIQIDTNAPTISVRGIHLNDFGDGNESPVSLYIDRVYQSTLATMNTGMFDVERVEVLRGPQGTLFGRNSTGGLLHLISHKPTEEFEATGSLQYGSYNERILEGTISGPWSDNVRGRLAGIYQKNDGWQENIVSGQDDYGSTDFLALRGMLDVDFSDNLNALFKVHYSDADNNHPQLNTLGGLDPDNPFIPLDIPGVGVIPGVFVPNKCPDELVLNGECVNGFTGDVQGDIGNEFFESDLQRTIPYIAEASGASVIFNLEVGEAMELVSITAYEYYDRFVEFDIDGSIAPVLQTIWTVETDQWTQEIHLSGSNAKMGWIVGGFYLADQKDLTFLSPQLTEITMTTLGHSAISDLETKSWAVFAQTDYAITDQVTLVGGLRYTDETRDLIITDSLTAPNFTDFESIDSSRVTWKAGVEWRPTDDLMLYLNATTGFKSGTFNTTLVVSGRAAPVAEETITTYEAGLKGDFLDGALRTNGAVFYSDYRDIQSVNSDIIGGGPINLLLNVPSADIYGLEMEAIITPVDYFQLLLNVGVLDTEINAPGLVIGNASVDGAELPVAAKVNLNVIAIVDFPIAESKGNLSFQASYAWQDDVNYSFTGIGTTIQKSFGLLNLNLRWNSPDARYFVETFVNNATDEEYVAGGFDITLNLDRVVGVPRWAGIKVGFAF